MADRLRICILSADVGHPTSGQSRFTVNLARGLSLSGHQVSIQAMQALPETVSRLSEDNISVSSLRVNTTASLFQARLMMKSSPVGKKLSELALRSPRADWYLVMSDSAVSAVRYLKGAPTVYLCQGDLALLFVNPGFYARHRSLKRVLRMGMSSIVIDNASSAHLFTIRLGNSNFTCEFMSYLYGCHFSDFIYPPVDTRLFRQGQPDTSNPYAIAVVRNSSEPGIQLLTRIARKVPLKVVGGAEVPGAVNLGVVSNEELARQFSSASVLLAPGVSEFYGYAVAEALSCGTPAISFDCCGPGEILRISKAGWGARSDQEFETLAQRAVLGTSDPVLRNSALRFAKMISIEASTRKLETVLTSEDKAISH